MNKRYLRCLDADGKNVFISFDQNTSISPIAGQTNISGVHTVKGLLEKFRLPITVRPVHGAISTKMDKNWSPVFRLVGAYSDETAFVMPLQRKEATMLTISTREPLQLVLAKNIDEVRSSLDFLAINGKGNSLVSMYKNSIHALVDLPNPNDVSKGGSRRSNAFLGKENTTPDDLEEEALLFEEIEEIYRYVRDGGDPPAPKVRPKAVNQVSTTTDNNTEAMDLYDNPSTIKSQQVSVSGAAASVQKSRQAQMKTTTGKNRSMLTLRKSKKKTSKRKFWQRTRRSELASSPRCSKRVNTESSTTKTR